MNNKYILIFLFLFGIVAGEKLVADNEERKPKELSSEELAKLLENVLIHKKVVILDSLVGLNVNDFPPFALTCANQAIELSTQIPIDTTVAHCYFDRAKAYKQLGEYEKALTDLDKALDLYVRLNNKVWQTSVNIDFGNIYYLKGTYDQAISYYLKAMKLAVEKNDVNTEALCDNNIGNVYFYQQNFDRAVEFYQRAYKQNLALGESKKAALCLDNIGLVYINKEEYDTAYFYQSCALKIVEKLNDKKFIAEILMNMGVANVEMKKYDDALKVLGRAADINKEIGSKYALSACLVNIGDVYRHQKKYNDAITKQLEALEMSKSIGAKNNIKEALTNLSQTYEEMNQPANALKYYKMYSVMKDSVMNQETSDQINELSAKYETDKKQKEIVLLTKDKDLSETKLKNQRLVNISLGVGLVLIFLMFGLMFYRFIEKKRANKLLEEKNFAINAQKELISEKNKEITDSINYAKRIQEAMLPSNKILNEYFKENFVFYQPKDIISGDFYWATRKDNKLFLAVADCTGHGVPGALMSMIGVSFLGQIVNEMNITDTAEILNKLHVMVLSALNEDMNMLKSKDGMDISLLKVDIINKKVEFAGGVRPLYVMDKNGLQMIKGDRFSIGGIKTLDESFSKIEVGITSTTSFYMFSDGFADQFGAASGKKYMTKKLQGFITDIYKFPMEEQAKLIHKEFNDWKGNVEQTDDVTVVGFRV